MGNNDLRHIAVETRAFVRDHLNKTEKRFAEIATFASEVNSVVPFVFKGGEQDGVVWFSVERPDDEYDQYKLKKDGRLTRTRHNERFPFAEDKRFGEFPCTPEEFSDAMANHLEASLKVIERGNEELWKVSCRILKPVIEFCDWSGTGRSVARLAATGFERSGESPGGAIGNLLQALGEKGLPRGSKSYTLVMILDFDEYRRIQNQRFGQR